MNTLTTPFRTPARHRTATLLAAVLTVGLAGGASAQQAVRGGNALDANQQVGSGGVNPNAPQVDYQARNLLITGQVTDGRQFRGDVDYGAVGTFGGTLGSDDLFRFRADAYSAQPRNFSAPSTSGFNAPAVIYNNFSVPTATPLDAGVRRTVVAPDGVRSAILNPSAYQVGNARTADVLPLPDLGRALRPAPEINRGVVDADSASLGLYRSADGQALEVTASPLTGVGAVPRRGAFEPVFAEPPTLPGPADPLDPASLNDPSAAPAPAGQRDARRSGAVSAGPAVADPALSGVAPGTPLDASGRPLNAQGSPAQPDRRSAVDAGSDPLPPAVQLGLRLNPAVGTTNRGNPGEDLRLERLRSRIFDPSAAQTGQPATGSDTASSYQELLDRIRDDAQRRVAGDDAAGDDAAGVRPSWMRAVEDPATDLVEQAERRRLDTLARLLREARAEETEQTPGRPSTLPQYRSPLDQAPAADPAAADPDEAVTRSEALESLIRQLSYDLPRLETLQGQRETRVSQGFAAAEKALADGEFFNAQALYRQLAVEARDNPLALVGQVHAEMGAGMIRSAVFHLRSLFENHPELIATRYGQNLLPNTDRLTWLQNELQRAINAQDQANLEPGILLAYLGWQVESRQLVRYGLAVAQEAAPTDPLLPVLRRIWLGETTDADAAAGQ